MFSLLKSTKKFVLTVAFVSIMSTSAAVQANYIDNSSEDYRMASNYEAVKLGTTNIKTTLMLGFSEYDRKDEYGNLCLRMIEALLNDDNINFTNIVSYAIEKFPDRWQSYFWNGYYNETKFRFVDAINNYIEALKINPESWVINRNIGRAYMGKAILSAGQVFKEKNINSPERFLTMLILKDESYAAFVNRFTYESDIAHAYFTKAISIYEADPVNTQANIEEVLDTYNKAAITTKNTDESLAYYNKVISYEGRTAFPWLKDGLDKVYIEAYAGAGNCYIKYGQYDKALLMYKQGCKIDKNSDLLKVLKRKIELARTKA